MVSLQAKLQTEQVAVIKLRARVAQLEPLEHTRLMRERFTSATAQLQTASDDLVRVTARLQELLSLPFLTAEQAEEQAKASAMHTSLRQGIARLTADVNSCATAATATGAAELDAAANELAAAQRQTQLERTLRERAQEELRTGNAHSHARFRELEGQIESLKHSYNVVQGDKAALQNKLNSFESRLRNARTILSQFPGGVEAMLNKHLHELSAPEQARAQKASLHRNFNENVLFSFMATSEAAGANPSLPSAEGAPGPSNAVPPLPPPITEDEELWQEDAFTADELEAGPGLYMGPKEHEAVQAWFATGPANRLRHYLEYAASMKLGDLANHPNWGPSACGLHFHEWAQCVKPLFAEKVSTKDVVEQTPSLPAVPQQTQDTRPLSIKPKHPPPFSGADKQIWEDFKFQFESYLDTCRVPKQDWPDHVLNMLEGKALQAWLAVAQPMRALGTKPTWENLADTMAKSFVHINIPVEARKALYSIRQQTRTSEYLRHFRLLLARVTEPKPADADLLNFYYTGLKQTLRDQCKLNPKTGRFWDNFEELADFTLQIDLHSRIASALQAHLPVRTVAVVPVAAAAAAAPEAEAVPVDVETIPVSTTTTTRTTTVEAVVAAVAAARDGAVMITAPDNPDPEQTAMRIQTDQSAASQQNNPQQLQQQFAQLRTTFLTAPNRPVAEAVSNNAAASELGLGAGFSFGSGIPAAMSPVSVALPTAHVPASQQLVSQLALAVPNVGALGVAQSQQNVGPKSAGQPTSEANVGELAERIAAAAAAAVAAAPGQDRMTTMAAFTNAAAHLVTLARSFPDPAPAATIILMVSDELRRVLNLQVSQAMSLGKQLTEQEVVASLKELIGYNMHDAKHIAMTRLVHGSVKQRTDQTVLEYAVDFRLEVMRADALPAAVLCDLFVKGLKATIAAQCARTSVGLLWTDLNECITYAIGKEATMPGGSRSGAPVAILSHQDQRKGVDRGHSSFPARGRGRGVQGLMTSDEGHQFKRDGGQWQPVPQGFVPHGGGGRGGPLRGRRGDDQWDRGYDQSSHGKAGVAMAVEAHGEARAVAAKEAQEVVAAREALGVVAVRGDGKEARVASRVAAKAVGKEATVAKEAVGWVALSSQHLLLRQCFTSLMSHLPVSIVHPIHARCNLPGGDQRVANMVYVNEPCKLDSPRILGVVCSSITKQVPLPFVFTARLGGRECVAMIDTGATYTILSEKWLNQPGYKNKHMSVTLLERRISVVAANNASMPITQQVHATVSIERSVTPVAAKILPEMLEGIDLILGADWQKSHGAVLDVGSNICHIKVGNKLHKLHSQHHKFRPGAAVLAAVADSGEAVKVLSAKQAARALRKGCCSVLALVQPSAANDDEGWYNGSLASVLVNNQEGCERPGLVPASVIDSMVHEEFPTVFQDMPAGLPPDRGVGHTIRLEPGHAPPYQRARRYSLKEMDEMRKQVAELLAKKLIEPSSSPYGAPVLFVQKRDGTLRMCIDFRTLNKLTVRDRYPLPRIDDLFDRVQGKTVFSSLDLQSGYHQIRITPEDVPKTAFVTPGGQFQYKVLCFGLTNAPATFQHVMNRIFEKQLLAGTVLVYLDDILVMSRSPAEHVQHLREVLQVMKDNNLYAKLSKCEFNKPELKFLGHIVGRHGIAVDPAKVQVIQDWAMPTCLKELQAFLGLANFFRRFIAGYSTIAAPLTHLTGEAVAAGTNWRQLSEPAVNAFNALKEALCSAPVLALPDPLQPFEVWFDASLAGTGGVLMQNGRVVAYTSHKFTPAQVKYTTGEQELLGIIRAMQEWRCYLDGAVHVTIVTDHNPLIYLKTQTNLSRRQARWMEFLARFDHHIEYKPGKGNVADPLSRNPGLTHHDDDDDGQPILLTMGAQLCVSGVYAMVMTRRQAGLQVQPPFQPPPVPPSQPAAPRKQKRQQKRARCASGGQPPPSVVPCDKWPDGGEKQLDSATHTPAGKTHSTTQGSSLVKAIINGYSTDDRFADRAYTQAYELSETGLWMSGGKLDAAANELAAAQRQTQLERTLRERAQEELRTGNAHSHARFRELEGQIESLKHSYNVVQGDKAALQNKLNSFESRLRNARTILSQFPGGVEAMLNKHLHELSAPEQARAQKASLHRNFNENVLFSFMATSEAAGANPSLPSAEGAPGPSNAVPPLPPPITEDEELWQEDAFTADELEAGPGLYMGPKEHEAVQAWFATGPANRLRHYLEYAASMKLGDLANHPNWGPSACGLHFHEWAQCVKPLFAEKVSTKDVVEQTPSLPAVPQQTQDTRPLSIKPKHPPPFSGADKQIWEDFKFQFESYLDTCRVPKQDWPDHVLNMLEGKALQAWLAVAQPMRALGTKPTWENLADTMAKSFVHINIPVEARKALYSIRQQTRTSEYLRHFRLLLARVTEPKPADADLLNFYYTGLKQTLRDQCKLNPKTGRFWDNFEELADFTLQIDLHSRIASALQAHLPVRTVAVVPVAAAAAAAPEAEAVPVDVETIPVSTTTTTRTTTVEAVVAAVAAARDGAVMITAPDNPGQQDI
ncbi:hypothetical protein QJQ45_003723 [Haematococcus lacustris]|nr:hypothetical protein QJQ45_003723 [Haematococcus lacustris]